MGTRGPSRARRPARRTVTPESAGNGNEDVCRVRPPGGFTDAAREAARAPHGSAPPPPAASLTGNEDTVTGRGGLQSECPLHLPGPLPGLMPAQRPLCVTITKERWVGCRAGPWRAALGAGGAGTARPLSSLGRAARAAARAPRAEVPSEPAGSWGEPALPAGIFSVACAALQRARLFRAACLLHLLT